MPIGVCGVHHEDRLLAVPGTEFVADMVAALHLGRVGYPDVDIVVVVRETGLVVDMISTLNLGRVGYPAAGTVVWFVVGTAGWHNHDNAAADVDQIGVGTNYAVVVGQIDVGTTDVAVVVGDAVGFVTVGFVALAAAPPVIAHDSAFVRVAVKPAMFAPFADALPNHVSTASGSLLGLLRTAVSTHRYQAVHCCKRTDP